MRVENYNRQHGATNRVREIQALFTSEGGKAFLVRSPNGQLVLPNCQSFGTRTDSAENVVCSTAGRLGLTVDMRRVHHLGTYNHSLHEDSILLIQADVCPSRRFFTRLSSLWASPEEQVKLKNLSKVAIFAIAEWQRQQPAWNDQAETDGSLDLVYASA